MSDSDPSPMALAATGRFQEALTALARRQQGKRGRMTATERLEFAELLERTGRLAEARDYLAAVNKSSGLSDAERARCLLVEGLLSKQLGHLEESLDRFQQGRRLAERAGSPELLGWCQLRLLGVSADIDGADLSASLLADLRKNTERAASPTISVACQIFLAEYSAKRGDLDTSKHHSSLAESILATYPNVWLRGLLDLHLSCLNYLEGNYLNSILAAHRALGTSSKSGNRLTGLIAQADMAAAYLAVGQPARAKACLSSALQRANDEEQIFGLLLETLAEAQLVSGDLVGCAESLRCAHDLSARFSQSRSAWHRAWNLRTESRLLQRSGRWQESLSLIRSAGSRESLDAQPFTRTQIEGLEALALARVGRSAEARGVIQRLVQDTLVSPRLYQGSVYGVAAALSAVADEGGEAIARCTRALRIVGATGEASSLVEIVDQLIGLLSRSSGCSDEPTCPNSQPPLWRPTNVMCHLHASNAVVPDNRPHTAGLVAFSSALADLTSDAAALGEEALRCLVEMRWIKCGHLNQCSDDGSRVVVDYLPDSSSTLINVPCRTPLLEPISVHLGSKRSRHYNLVVTPLESDGAAASCYGIVRLLASIRGATMIESRAGVSIGSGEVPQTDDKEGVFRSPAMLALIASAKRVAPLNISVLLTGESGTGKEVVASIIHRTSGLPRDAFVAFNCATVPRDMIDSQLFGYRHGAFTGAAQGFGGVIGAADGGTLMLDEVGELPWETQPKLLRFLDSGEIVALGEATPRRVRVRVIAATNADLESLVHQGRFREDLYYRLNVVRFRLPPLRERREEITPLVSTFISKYASEFGKHDVSLSDAARELLLLFSWPGNIRQLSHELRRLVALSSSESVIDVEDLDSDIRGPSARSSQPLVPGAPCISVRIDRKLSDIVREIECTMIAKALESANGRLGLAAKRLGLSRKGLYLKRQRHGLL